MIKRIIAILLVFSMLPFCVYAEDTADETDYRLETLCGLGILSDEYSKSYSVRNKVTYKDYLSAIAGFMTEEQPEDLPEFSRRYSLIRYNEAINLSDNINYIEAIKILVRAGGYSEQIPNGESEAMYQREAAERKLLKGVGYKQDSQLTADDFITLLYNAIDAYVVDYNYLQNGVEREVNSDETILSRYRDIYEYEGIVEDNGQTTLTNLLPQSKRYIAVNGERFLINGIDATSYLGMKVRVFYQDNDAEFVLKFVIPEENKIIETLTDEVSVRADFKSLTYYDEDDEKIRTAKLDAALKVIYNGELFYDYTEADFAGTNGSLRLIDNDEDGEYEVALIDKYETVVASYITGYDSKLINKYTYSGVSTGIELDNEDEEVQVSYYLDGQPVEEPVISEWTVLSIAESLNGGRVKKILLSEARETGILEGISQTDGYSINGEVYKLNDTFVAALAADDVMVPQLIIGKEYTVFFDAFGKIAAVKQAENTSLQYVVMTRLRQDEMDEEAVTLRYMDSTGVWYTKPLRKKVRLYNDTYDGTSLKASQIFNVLTDSNRKVVPQVIQMSLNDDGEVNILKIAVRTDNYEKDKLTVRNEVSGCYRWTTKMLGSANGPLLYFAENTIIYVFPSSTSYNESDYSVQSAFMTDEDYSVIPYNVDEFMTSECVVIKGKETGTKQDSLFIVDSVSHMLNADGEAKKVLIGQFGEYSGFSLMANDDSVFDDVKKGDVLKLYTDNRSRVINKDIIFSSDTGKQTQMTVDYSGLAAGTVKKIDPSTKTVLIDCGTGTFAFKPNESDTSNKLTTYLNDASEQKSQVVDFSDVLVGDFVVANIYFARLKDLIIIRNY